MKNMPKLLSQCQTALFFLLLTLLWMIKVRQNETYLHKEEPQQCVEEPYTSTTTWHLLLMDGIPFFNHHLFQASQRGFVDHSGVISQAFNGFGVRTESTRLPNSGGTLINLDLWGVVILEDRV